MRGFDVMKLLLRVKSERSKHRGNHHHQQPNCSYTSSLSSARCLIIIIFYLLKFDFFFTDLGLKGNNNSSPSRDPLHVPKKKCTVFNPENVQTWALIGILVLIVLGVAVAIGLALQKNERQYDGAQHQPPTSEKREILFGNEYEDETSEYKYSSEIIAY